MSLWAPTSAALRFPASWLAGCPNLLENGAWSQERGVKDRFGACQACVARRQVLFGLSGRWPSWLSRASWPLGRARIGCRRRSAPGQAAAVSPVSAADQAVFTRYCLTCHTDALRRRGTVPVAFETLDVTRVGRDAKTWESIVRKMRSGLMPPAGMPRPDARHARRLRPPDRGRARRRGGRAPQPRPDRAVPPPESHRVSQRRARSARSRRQRGVAAAARRRQLRLRQHGRRAEDVADAAGALPGGGAEGQPSGDRHAAAGAHRRTTSASPTICGRTRTSGRSRSARAAARRFDTSFRWTAST